MVYYAGSQLWELQALASSHGDADVRKAASAVAAIPIDSELLSPMWTACPLSFFDPETSQHTWGSAAVTAFTRHQKCTCLPCPTHAAQKNAVTCSSHMSPSAQVKASRATLLSRGPLLRRHVWAPCAHVCSGRWAARRGRSQHECLGRDARQHACIRTRTRRHDQQSAGSLLMSHVWQQ